MTSREQRIVELTQEKLAELIGEYVAELHESYEETADIDEDEIEKIAQDLFDTHKGMIREAAMGEFEEGHHDDIFEAVYKGFFHLGYCKDTAIEKAKELL